MKNRLALFFILLDHADGDLTLHSNRYRAANPRFWPDNAQSGDLFECYLNGNPRSESPISITTLRSRLAYVQDQEWLRASQGAPVPVDAAQVADLVMSIAHAAERDGTTGKPSKFDDTVIAVCEEKGVDVRLWRVFDLAFHWWNDLLGWAEDPNLYDPDVMKAWVSANRGPIKSKGGDDCDDDDGDVSGECQGFEIEPGIFSGCTASETGATDCPACGPTVDDVDDVGDNMTRELPATTCDGPGLDGGA